MQRIADMGELVSLTWRAAICEGFFWITVAGIASCCCDPGVNGVPPATAEATAAAAFRMSMVAVVAGTPDRWPTTWPEAWRWWAGDVAEAAPRLTAGWNWRVCLPPGWVGCLSEPSLIHRRIILAAWASNVLMFEDADAVMVVTLEAPEVAGDLAPRDLSCDWRYCMESNTHNLNRCWVNYH